MAMQDTMKILSLFLCICNVGDVFALLTPQDSESREVKELNGMWSFRADKSPGRDAGFKEGWFERPLSDNGPVIPMPVPSSYNDITVDKSLRDFVGWAWYDRNFFVSPDWQRKRIVLRFESAHYNTIVWVNSNQVTQHVGGHLPFEVEVNQFLTFSGENRLTVAVNNTLTPHTLPPGTIQYQNDRNRYPEGYFVQNVQFDFFNYAGIHRSVRLYTTPKTYIKDLVIKTVSVTHGEANIEYNVALNAEEEIRLKIDVLDRSGQSVATEEQRSTGYLTIPNVHLWWPYTMSKQDKAYLYRMQVTVSSSSSGMILDVYRQTFGVRTINVTETSLLINNRPFYCHGVDKHEDSDIRGKGLDLPLIARDFYMLKWMNVNCFRTSHYPYAEEILDQADEQGIVVINECPGVGIKTVENFSNISLAHHLEVMAELVGRDKNRPSTVMWSVANEPASNRPEAEYYFKTVIAYTRQLDPTRPVTFVANVDVSSDRAVQFVDVICINRYYGWYSDTGHTEVIQLQLTYDLTEWFQKFRRPIILSEYGADTVAGLHTAPSFVFTEDYQVDFMAEYHAAFDKLRTEFLIGELVWNFADFMTVQQVTRVVGNKKGLLTRQRQPKAAAHMIRLRYQRIANETESVVKLPSTKSYYYESKADSTNNVLKWLEAYNENRDDDL